MRFFFENPSKWCNDELYNCFARDKRFEPTVFFYQIGDELIRKEFDLSLEKFKEHGLNIFEIKSLEADVPAQDVLINLLPYDNGPLAFRLVNLKLTTLMVHFDYGINSITWRGFADTNFYYVLWKMFFASIPEKEWRQKSCKVGIPRGFFSGYPRMDIFFNPDVKFHFDWKMTRPDAKKIIWAPHHSVMINNSTFRFNHKFMYEFAKAHTEISWVVKPHPLLFNSAVNSKVFLSVEAFEEYLQKWNDLSNAQVYAGAYYQDVFATSDGMIHDSCSFINEYQYVNKPMIYLLREGKLEPQFFNKLSEEVLNASYLVDGKNLDAIAAMMQRVFIEGDDFKATERKAVFDKYLNYPKLNGMLASEFIYKNISQELEKKS